MPSAVKYLGLLAAFFSRYEPTGQPGGPPYVNAPLPDQPPPFVCKEIVRADYRGGVVPQTPTLLLATCTSTEKVGQAVYVTSSYDSANSAPTVAVADPTNAAKMPAIGTIEYKLGDTVAVVNLGAGAELQAVTPGSLTVGALYFVGTDGFPAKSGGGNLPTSGQVKQALGVAISTSLLVRVPNLLTTTF